MKRKILLLVWCCAFVSPMYAQVSIGVKLGVGVSYVDYRTSRIVPTAQASVKMLPMPSGQAGFFFKFHLRNRFSFTTELLFSQIEGDLRSKVYQLNNKGQQTGNYMVGNDYLHLSYFTVPLYLGYKINALSINLGIQPSLKIAASEHLKITIPDGYGGTYNRDFRTKNTGTKGYDLGFRLGLIYKLSEKFAIDANYYFGFNNIVLSTNKYGTSNNSQIHLHQGTIGIRYILVMTKKKVEQEVK